MSILHKKTHFEVIALATLRCKRDFNTYAYTSTLTLAIWIYEQERLHYLSSTLMPGAQVDERVLMNPLPGIGLLIFDKINDLCLNALIKD